MSLLSTLSSQKTYPKFYWKPKGRNIEIAAWGCKKEFFEIPIAKKQLLFGGVAFSIHRVIQKLEFDVYKDSLWEGFPPIYFFEPTYCIQQEYIPPITTPYSIRVAQLTHLPCFEEWTKSVESLALDKVVLARKTSFVLQEAVDPLQLLQSMQQREPHASFFALQLSEDATFIGSSPEMLYSRAERLLVTEALAGTCKKGSTFSEKEKLEFNYVVDFIHRTLKTLCKDVDEEEVSLIYTSTLQHLYKRFKGALKADISDKDLIEALHPTPALGGTPRELALKQIRELEPFQRGWYGGAIGMLSEPCTELAVGIRSALITKKELHLFAGAGIVQGSQAKAEWDELDHKIASWKTTFAQSLDL